MSGNTCQRLGWSLDFTHSSCLCCSFLVWHATKLSSLVAVFCIYIAPSYIFVTLLASCDVSFWDHTNLSTEAPSHCVHTFFLSICKYYLTQEQSRSTSPLASWHPYACPVSKCGSFPLSQSDITADMTKRQAAPTACTAWNPRSSCQKEPGGNALLLSPAHVLWNLLGCEEGSTWNYSTPPWTFMSAFTDSLNRSSSGLDRFSVYCLKSICLHLHSWDDNLNFHHVLVLAHKFLARLQVCEACRDISRYFCGTVSESLAAEGCCWPFISYWKNFFHVWKDCAKMELWISVFI